MHKAPGAWQLKKSNSTECNGKTASIAGQAKSNSFFLPKRHGRAVLSVAPAVLGVNQDYLLLFRTELEEHARRAIFRRTRWLAQVFDHCTLLLLLCFDLCGHMLHA